MKPVPRLALLAATLLACACSGGTVNTADDGGATQDLSTPPSPRDMAVPVPDLTTVDFAYADFAGADLIGIDFAPPPPPPDMTTPPDLMSPYLAATINQIDTAPGNGAIRSGTLVSLDRIVAVTDVDKYVNATNQQCRYQIWVQDPMCNTPPCGMVLKAIGPMAPSPNSTGKDCPAARISGTLLANIARGDNVKVTGKLTFEVDDVAPMTVIEHQLFVDSVTPVANNAVITPTVISDTTLYSQLVTHSGMLWNKYEGMSVTLAPAKGTLQVSALSGNGFRTIPGSTDWGNTFDSDYIPNGQNVFPTLGSVWKSISGVVSCRHGGEVMPVRNKDFVP